MGPHHVCDRKTTKQVAGQEVQGAESQVPDALLVSNAVNFTLSWLASVVMSLCTPDVGAYLESSLALSTPNGAFLQIFLYATGSRVGAICLSLPIICTIFVSCCNAVACASRQLWAFAGDEGVPFSDWLFQKDVGTTVRSCGMLLLTGLLDDREAS